MITAIKARELYLKTHEQHEVAIQKLGEDIERASKRGECSLEVDYKSNSVGKAMLEALSKCGYVVSQEGTTIKIRW